MITVPSVPLSTERDRFGARKLLMFRAAPVHAHADAMMKRAAAMRTDVIAMAKTMIAIAVKRDMIAIAITRARRAR